MRQTPFIVLVMALALGMFYIAGHFRGAEDASLESDQLTDTEEGMLAEQERPFIVPEYLRRDFPNTDFTATDDLMKSVQEDVGTKDLFGGSSPEFLPVSEVTHAGTERLLVLTNGTDTKAYPFSLVEEQQIINDEFAGRPIVVVWCRSCGGPNAFGRRLPGGESVFKSAGASVRGMPLMYDEHTGSLWLQGAGRGVAGVYQGEQLRALAAETMEMSVYGEAYSGGFVLK